jgi:hypothetical protein
MGPVLVATGVRYLHARDEAAFFAWLRKMPCVASFDGAGRDLFIQLKRPPTDADLRELLGFFHRYAIDMRQLAQFASDKRTWFSALDTYWHTQVFGS